MVGGRRWIAASYRSGMPTPRVVALESQQSWARRIECQQEGAAGDVSGVVKVRSRRDGGEQRESTPVEHCPHLKKMNKKVRKLGFTQVYCPATCGRGPRSPGGQVAGVEGTRTGIAERGKN